MRSVSVVSAEKVRKDRLVKRGKIYFRKDLMLMVDFEMVREKVVEGTGDLERREVRKDIFEVSRSDLRLLISTFSTQFSFSITHPPPSSIFLILITLTL